MRLSSCRTRAVGAFLGSDVGETLNVSREGKEKERKEMAWSCWNRRKEAKLSLHLSQVTQISLIGPIEGLPVIGVIWEQGKHLNLARY